MKKHKLAAVLAAVLLATSTAPAAVVLDVIDRGTPTDGVTTLDGFRGYVLRLRSTTGDPIIGYQFFGLNGYITGGLLQRWVDPFGDGNYQSTPVDAADGTFDTPWNFDSHALPAPDATFFDATENVFSSDPSTLEPLPDTPSVAYFDQLSSMGMAGQIPAELGTMEFEFAYIVTDSSFSVYGVAAVQADSPPSFNYISTQVVVPEPVAPFLVPATLSSLLRRRRRPVVEKLERRAGC